MGTHTRSKNMETFMGLTKTEIEVKFTPQGKEGTRETGLETGTREGSLVCIHNVFSLYTSEVNKAKS